MFSKRKSTDPTVASGPAVPSIISSDMHITGTLVADGEMQIDGTVEGTLRATELVIGENGNVTGELVGEKITVRGRVNGPIRGIHVKLAANAHVDGDIVHETLEVENGAVFEGSIRRSSNPMDDKLKQLTGPTASIEPVETGDAGDEAEPKPEDALSKTKAAD